MGGHLVNLTIAATATGVVDLNYRQVNADSIVLISSNKAVTVSVYDGMGGTDPLEAVGAVPYVVGGSSIPIYDEVGASYAVAAGTNTKIRIARKEVGDWIKLSVGNTEVTAATVSIYGSF